MLIFITYEEVSRILNTLPENIKEKIAYNAHEINSVEELNELVRRLYNSEGNMIY